MTFLHAPLSYTYKFSSRTFPMLTFHAKDIIIISNVFVISLAQMPAKYRKNKVKPRGVSNRNRGLQWIRANATEGNGFNVKTLSTPTNCDKFIYLFSFL